MLSISVHIFRSLSLYDIDTYVIWLLKFFFDKSVGSNSFSLCLRSKFCDSPRLKWSTTLITIIVIGSSSFCSKLRLLLVVTLVTAVQVLCSLERLQTTDSHGRHRESALCGSGAAMELLIGRHRQEKISGKSWNAL